MIPPKLSLRFGWRCNKPPGLIVEKNLKKLPPEPAYLFRHLFKIFGGGLLQPVNEFPFGLDVRADHYLRHARYLGPVAVNVVVSATA